MPDTVGRIEPPMLPPHFLRSRPYRLPVSPHAQVTELLRRYLGAYVEGLDREKLKISVWKGDVVLKNLKFKPEALDHLHLPVRVAAGRLGTLRIKVPWHNLGKESVVVEIDDVFCLARRTKPDGTGDEDDEDTKRGAEGTLSRAADDPAENSADRRQRIDDAERAWLLIRSAGVGNGSKRGAAAAAGAGGGRAPPDATTQEKGWLARYGATIIGNLVITVTNVHVRYEDDITTPGHPFAAGITVARLAGITVDERGIESFVASDSFSRVRKRVQLEHAAVYFDDGDAPGANVQWIPKGGWAGLGPDDGDKWWEMFGPGIQGVPALPEHDAPEFDGRGFAAGRQYLLQPVGGELTYVRKGLKDPNTGDEPRQLLDFRVGSVRGTLHKRQYRDIARLLDVFSSHQLRAPHAHLRPTGRQSSPTLAPTVWWVYACTAVNMRRRRGRGGFLLRWDALKKGAAARRQHNALFLAVPEDSAAAANIMREVEDIESRVPYEVALTWRCLAHATLPRGLAECSSSVDISLKSFASDGSLKQQSVASSPVSLALSARRAAAVAASTGGTAVASSASRTGVRKMFSKGWRWARGKQPTREVFNVEGIEVRQAMVPGERGSDGGGEIGTDSPDTNDVAGNDSDVFTDEDWSKLDIMLGVEGDQLVAPSKGDAEEVQIEVRGRFAKMSVSLQDDSQTLMHSSTLGEGRHTEVLGSSALSTATCLRVHSSGRWEIRLGVAAWVCTGQEGAVLVSGNAASQFEAAAVATASEMTIDPPWWKNPFEHASPAAEDRIDEVRPGAHNPPALDLMYGTYPPHAELDSKLTAAVAPSHLTMEHSTLAHLAGFFTDDVATPYSNVLNELDSLAGSTSAYANARMDSESVSSFGRMSSTGGSVDGGGDRGVTVLRKNTTKQLETGKMLSLRRIAVHLEIAAPKIALPVRRVDGTVRFQGLVDLGHFTFRSAAAVNTEEAGVLGESSSKLSNDRPVTSDATFCDPYEYFHVQWRDLSIHLAAADFDWRASGAGATMLEGCEAVLERCGAVANIALLTGNGSGDRLQKSDGGPGPPLRIKVRLPAIALHLSPGRIARILAIMSAATGGKQRGNSGSSGHFSVDGSVRMYTGREQVHSGNSSSQMRRLWDSPALEGPANVLETGARGLRGGWQPRWLALKGVYLYILDARDSPSALAVVRLGHTLCATLIPDEDVPVAAGGPSHGPIVVLHHPTVPVSVATSKLSVPGAWLLRWPQYLLHRDGVRADPKAAAERWLAQVQWANDSLLTAVGHPVPQEEALRHKEAVPGSLRSQVPSATAAAAAAATTAAVNADPMTFELHGELGHLKVLVSGQPMGIADDVDDDSKGLAAIGIEGLLDGPAPGEELIINLSAKAARVRLTTTATDTEMSIGLRSLELQDILCGHINPRACNVIALAGISTSDARSRRDSEGPQVPGATAATDSPDPPMGPDGNVQSYGSEGEIDDDFFDAESSFASFATNPGRSMMSRATGSLAFQSLAQGSPVRIPRQSSTRSTLTSPRTSTGPAGESSFDYSHGDHNEDKGQEGENQDAEPDSVQENQQEWADVVFRQWGAESPAYVGVQNELMLCMDRASLSLARPTIASLWRCREEISTVIEALSQPESDPENVADVSSQGLFSEGSGATSAHIVKKMTTTDDDDDNRVSFRLVLQLSKGADLVVFREDGHQLAELEVETLTLDLKNRDRTMGMHASLGNLQFVDAALPLEHPYRYLCDIRGEDGGSKVDIDLRTHAMTSSSFPGHEWELNATLKAVRIIYRSRFISELLAYFGSLLPNPLPLDALPLEIRAAVERQRGEARPMTLKYALNAEAPVVIFPRRTDAEDAVEMDLSCLRIENVLEWRFGSSHRDPGAALIDIIHWSLNDVALRVIQGRGAIGDNVLALPPGIASDSPAAKTNIALVMRHPKWDQLHRVTSLEVEISSPALHVEVDEDEYRVCCAVLGENFSEIPDLPPRLFEAPEIMAPAQPLQRQSAAPSPPPSWLRLTIHLPDVKLTLFHTPRSTRIKPLASLQMGNMWAAYRAAHSGDSSSYNLLLTLPKAELTDLRPTTLESLRSVILSREHVTDNARDVSTLLQLELEGISGNTSSLGRTQLGVRLQATRMLCDPAFVLTVYRFLFQTDEEMAAAAELERRLTRDVHVEVNEEGTFFLPGDTRVSPRRRLLADAPGGPEEVIVDGTTARHAIHITGHKVGSHPATADDSARQAPGRGLEASIIVAPGRTLRLKNTRVILPVGCSALEDHVLLGPGARLFASLDDNVVIVTDWTDTAPAKLQSTPLTPLATAKGKGGDPNVDPVDIAPSAPLHSTQINLAAPGLEVILVEPGEAGNIGGKDEGVLRATMGLALEYAVAGGSVTAKVNVAQLGLHLDQTRDFASLQGSVSAAHVPLLSPVDASAHWSTSTTARSVNGSLQLSPVDLRCSPQSAEVLSRLIDGVALLVRTPRDAPLTTECSVFDSVWASGVPFGAVGGEPAPPGSGCLTFWRPRAPPGYAALGDIAVGGSSVPTRAVIVVNDAVGLLHPPTGFERLWHISRPRTGSGDRIETVMTVWAPVPPVGCVALGHVVSIGDAPPPVASVRCVRREVISAAHLGPSIYHRLSEHQPPCESSGTGGLIFPPGTMWQVDNRAGTFIMTFGTERPHPSTIADLRVPILLNVPDAEDTFSDANDTVVTALPTTLERQHGKRRRLQPGGDGIEDDDHFDWDPSSAPDLGPRMAVTHEFTRVWWETGEAGGPGASRAASLWRPTPPPGHVSLGDVILPGVEPPPRGAPTVSARGGVTVDPLGFELVCWAGSGRGRDPLAVWRPIPPAGYVAVGDCASLSRKEPPPLDACACLRADLAERVDPGALTAGEDDHSDVVQHPHQPPVWVDLSTRWRQPRAAMWALEPRARDGTPEGIWGLFVGQPGISTPCTAYLPAHDRGGKDPQPGQGDSSAGAKPASLFLVDVRAPRISAMLLSGSGSHVPLAALTVADLVGTIRDGGDGIGTRDGFLSFSAALDFFNVRLRVWEPVIEPVNSFIKYSRAPNPTSSGGSETSSSMSLARVPGGPNGMVSGGASLSFTAASPLKLAASTACVDAVLEEWSRERARTSPNAAATPATAGDAHLVVTFVNGLTRPVFLRLPPSYSSSTASPLDDGLAIVSITPADTVDVCRLWVENEHTSLPSSIKPSAPSTKRERTKTGSRSACWSLAVTIRSARGLPPGGGANAVGGSEVVATVDLSFPGGVHLVELRSGAQSLPVGASRACEWNERFIVPPPAGSGASGVAPTRGFLSEVVVTVAVTDVHADGGNGEELASTALTLDDLLTSRGGWGGGRAEKNEGARAHVKDDEAVVHPGTVFRGTLRLPLNGDDNNPSMSPDVGPYSVQPADAELDITVEVTSGVDCDRAVDPTLANDTVDGIGSSTASSLVVTEEGPGAKGVAVGLGKDGPWVPLSVLDRSTGFAAGVSYFRVGGIIAALEESLTSTLRRKFTVRSLATFVNSTEVPLQITLAPAGSPPASVSFGSRNVGRSDPGGSLVTEEAFEHQRYVPMRGWSDKHLMATERRRWSRRDGSASAKEIDEFCYRAAVLLPEGWRWDGNWTVEVGHHCDTQGWAYGTSFLDLGYPFAPGRGSMGRASFVRMRRWVRRRSLIPARVEDLSAAGVFSTIVPPGGTTGLPAAVLGPDATVHFHVRRFLDSQVQGQAQDQVPYNWGVRPSHEGTGGEGGTGSQLLARREIGAELLLCTPPIGGGSGSASTGNWWLSLQSEATPVVAAAHHRVVGATETHTTSTTPSHHQAPLRRVNTSSRFSVLDWRLVASAPLTLENALPLAAQITLLEAPAAAGLDKIRPVASMNIAPGGVQTIHTLNPTSAQYLQLALEGGWRPPTAGPPLAISPASRAAMPSLAGQAEGLRARGRMTPGNATNGMLLAAPDGRHVTITADHTSFRGLPLAPRVTRLSVPVHLLNRCQALDIEFRVVAAPLARKGAEGPTVSGGVQVDPAFARCSRMESSAVRFVPTVRLLAGGPPTQVLAANHTARTPSSMPRGMSIAMLSVPREQSQDRGGRPAGMGLALEVGIRGDFALSPPIPLTEEELVQGAVIVDAIDRLGRKRQLTVHMQLGWEGKESGVENSAAPSTNINVHASGKQKPSLGRRDATGTDLERMVVIEPHVSMTNHAGETVMVRQAGGNGGGKEEPTTTLTADATVPSPLVWTCSTNPERLQVRLERTAWSAPFALNTVAGESVDVPVRTAAGKLILVQVKVHVMSLGVSQISFTVRSDFPYVVENATMDCTVMFRQDEGNGRAAWTRVAPCSSVPFAWDRPLEPLKLEMKAMDSPSQHYALVGGEELGGQWGGGGGGGTGLFADGDVEELTPLPRGRRGRGDDPSSSGSGGSDELLLVFRLSRGSTTVLRLESPASTHDASAALLAPRVGSAAAAAQAAAAWAALKARGDELRLTVNLPDGELALIDSAAEEIAVLHTGGIRLERHTGLGGGVTALSATVEWAQLDDMNVASAHPVVVVQGGRQRVVSKFGEAAPSLVNVKVTTKPSPDGQTRVYPYLKVDVTPVPLFLCVHEPLIWRLADFAAHFEATGGSNRVDGASSHDSGTVDEVPEPMSGGANRADMLLFIGLMRVSAVKLRISFKAAPEGRPHHAPRVLSSGPLSVANLDDLPLELRSLTVQRLHSRESLFKRQMSDAYGRQVWRQALRLLASVDMLDSVSQALGQASAGVAAMSLDPSFVKARATSSSSSFRAAVGRVIAGDGGSDGATGDEWQCRIGLTPYGLAGSHAPPRQSIASVGTGIMDGAEMLAKGVIRGVTGVLTKPVEGAMEEGAAGFVKGVGRGLLGVVTQPVSGTLGLASRTTEGIAASGKAVSAAVLGLDRSRFGFRGGRIRLPRAASVDGVLRPFEGAAARGQHLLRTAERGAYLGTMDPFRRRGRYRTDVFLDMIDRLPGGLVVVLTNRRVLLLRRRRQRGAAAPSSEDQTACVAVWDVRWENILAVELSSTSATGAAGTSSPLEGVVLHLKRPSKGHYGIFDSRRNDMTRTVQCAPGTGQANRTWEIIHRLSQELGGRGDSSEVGGAGVTGDTSNDAWDELDGMQSADHNQLEPPDEAAAAWDMAGDVPASPSNRPPSLPCLDFRLVWDSAGAPVDAGGGLPFPFAPTVARTGGGDESRATIWEPVSALTDYVALGHVIEAGPDPPGLPVAVYYAGNAPQSGYPPLFARPERYELIWRQSTEPQLTLWRPVPPVGFVALGSVALAGSREPTTDIRVGWCVREDLVRRADFFTGAAWSCGGDEGSGEGVVCVQVDNDACTFVASRGRGGEVFRPAADMALKVDAGAVAWSSSAPTHM